MKPTEKSHPPLKRDTEREPDDAIMFGTVTEGPDGRMTEGDWLTCHSLFRFFNDSQIFPPVISFHGHGHINLDEPGSRELAAWLLVRADEIKMGLAAEKDRGAVR